MRHFLLYNLRSKRLDDCRLADARFADKHRIVFPAARQYLSYTIDLIFTAIHGVKLVFHSSSREVYAKLVEHRGFRLAASVTHPVSWFFVKPIYIRELHAFVARQFIIHIAVVFVLNHLPFTNFHCHSEQVVSKVELVENQQQIAGDFQYCKKQVIGIYFVATQ